jgi:hypothetical protein
MADFSFPTLPAVTPPQQTSLGDMMNIARGAQAYQQAQQINPLDLQAKQMAVQQAQQVNPLALRQQAAQTTAAEGTLAPTIAKAGSEAETAATGSEAAKLALAAKKAQTISNGYVGAINDPIVLQAASNPDSVDKNQLFQFINNFGKNQAKAAGVPEEQAIAIMQPYLKVAQNNPAALRSYLIQRHVAGLDQSAQLGTYQTQTTVNALGQTVKVTPGLGTQKVEIGIPGGLQGAAASGQVPAGTEVAPGMSVPYPVRSAAQPYIAEPTEAKDQAAGAEYRNNLVNNQMSLTQGRRNVQEVIKQATGINEKLYFPEGGIFGQAEQKILSSLKSDQYDLLAKDLANMHITNSRAMGTVGNTVAGLDMAAVAGGTVKVPPKVLIDIARRVQADQTNLDMQANGAQQFAQKFGDNNMKTFQQSWTANARDTKIFEAINLLENETNPDKLKTEFEKLFPTEKKRKTILKQYKNLKSLAATGLQAQPLSPEDF